MRNFWKCGFVVIAAAIILGGMSGGCGKRPSRAEVLSDSVNLSDADARRKAFYEMGKWKNPEDELVELVELTLLGETDPVVRMQVARTLGIWGQAESVPELTTCLEKDPVAAVRAECARSLGQIKTEESRATLAKAVRGDPRSEVRVAAAQALREHQIGRASCRERV